MAEFGNVSFNTTGAGKLNGTDNSQTYSMNSFIIAASFVLIISFLGMIGNSLVVWYLGFRIKRTKYTVYILNLAVADLIYLICISITMCVTIVLFVHPGEKISNPRNVLFGMEIFSDFGNAADMFLLTAISVERCLSVFYPIWYRCNRPKLQSVVVCVFLWGLSGLVTLVDNLACPPETFSRGSERCTAIQTFLSVLTFLITIPIMIASSVILVIKIQRTSKRGQPPKLFVVIVASVIVFLISVAPVRVLWLLTYLKVLPSSFHAGAFFFVSYLCISVNSSANPFIYFLVGRHNMHGVREYLERALKKVFREDDGGEEEGDGMTKSNVEGDTTDSNIS
ncbi:proto-oncogene Mas-like [Ambystoma mexicanum]|uniref:proto-oncogene Mas-like n=1 Tax=Ambystoma mexicanum TaxID=8296 RepID=UPI0037E886CA